MSSYSAPAPRAPVGTPIIFASPGRYIQGPNVLAQCATHIKPFGTEVVVLIPEYLKNTLGMGPIIQKSMQSAGMKFEFILFGGECSKDEINRACAVIGSSRKPVVLGVGGGKCLDCGKAVAFKLGLPIIIAPTQASTDAPTSALSVIYSPKGDFEEYLFHKANPSMVLMDSSIIAAAPVRFMLAGVGDGMSTYYEALACHTSGSLNCVNGRQTLTGMALAKLCRDTLFENAHQCVLDMKARPGVSTPAVERVIEANTLLSGLGFESAGLAAAHALHNGLTVLECTHKFLHGEKVAFCTIALLCLEKNVEEAIKVSALFKKIGLAYRLGDLGIKVKTQHEKELLMKACEKACAPGETMHNEPFPVTPKMVFKAALQADSIGHALDAGCCGAKCNL